MPAHAETLEALLPYVIENHDRVRASKSKLTAARNRAREALGSWYPTLSQTANAGHEKQQNDNGSDSSTGFNEWDISLTQLLWDFGSTNSAIDKARLQVEEARFGLIETRQSLILEAITAYMNVIRSNAALKFAKDSEENIRRQTGLEEALVVLGSGFSTDVLQVKSQLAGAQARRVQSEGGLITALNRFQAVYGRMPDNLEALETVPFPASYLPQSLVQATDIALESNPTLKNAILAADIAMEDVRIAKADNFFPKIEASGERKFKKNVGGTIGSEQETLAKVEMTFDFNLGFTAVNTLRASESDLSATTFTAGDTRRTIEEQVRNAWQQLETAKQTASHLNNQANIEAAFLELARNERQLGRRTLLEVLSSETKLINAKSDAFSAETDMTIAAYGVLAATGQLEYDVIKGSKGTEPPRSQLPSPTPNAETPLPAPTLPVTPATGQLNGEIEPDVAVADGRSVSQLRSLFQQIDTPDVSVLPDTVFNYGRSQSGELLAIPNHPPKPKSRYDSFSDFDAQTSSFAVVEEDPGVEFASSDPAVLPSDLPSIPADSDMGTGNAYSDTGTEDIDGAAATGNSYDVASADDYMLNASTADTVETASLPAAEDAAPATRVGSFFSNLMTFFTDAHQAALNDRDKPQRQTSVSLSMPPMPIPEPDTEIEAIKLAANDAPAEVVTDAAPAGTDPISKFFGNFISFLENAQPEQAAIPNAAVQDEIAAAAVHESPETAAIRAVPLAEAEEFASVPHEADAMPDAAEPIASEVGAKIGSFSDLLNFFEAAHQRALADDAKKKSRTANETTSQTRDPAPEVKMDDAAIGTDTTKNEDVPFLFALLGNIFHSSNEMIEKIEYQPITDDSLVFSDR